MHLVTLLCTFTALASVSVASNVPSDDITQALTQGDSAAATVGILSVGNCDLIGN